MIVMMIVLVVQKKMNTGKYIFAQLTEFLPRRQFDIIVDKYKGNHYVKHFTCWNHMLCMMFGQLSHRESLSDLVLCIEAHKNKKLESLEQFVL